MTNEPTVPIKIETMYISEKEQPQNVIESHKALHKTEDLGQNLNQTQEDNADQAVCGHIYKSENKNILTQSTSNESGMISVLNHDWEMFECNQCYKKFKSRSARYTHKKSVHLGIIPTVLHCDQCAFTTKRKDHMKDHIKNIHEKEVCDLCGKDFSFRSLIDHKRVVHEGILYNCTQCGQNLSTKGNLAAHQAGHKEGKRFACTQRGHGFMRKAARDDHMKSSHISVKNLTCST